MEARGMMFYNSVYGSFRVDGDTDDATMLANYMEGYINSPTAYLERNGRLYW